MHVHVTIGSHVHVTFNTHAYILSLDLEVHMLGTYETNIEQAKNTNVSYTQLLT